MSSDANEDKLKPTGKEDFAAAPWIPFMAHGEVAILPEPWRSRVREDLSAEGERGQS